MAVDGRLAAALLGEERRHSQPALVSDDSLLGNSSGGPELAPSAAVREASYQRVTVRESIASLRARNALPQTGATANVNNANANASGSGGGGGNQSLSLTDDTSSLYERLDHPLTANRRSFGPHLRDAVANPQQQHQLMQQQQPLLPPRPVSMSSPHPPTGVGGDGAGDFYAEISGDDASEAYGEGDIVSALTHGLRHSSSGPLRLMSSGSSSGGGPAVLPGSGADRVLIEMSGFRHIDSDLDVSQTGTPISSRRGFSRPMSPPPDGAIGIGPSAALNRRSLMTPLMERSIEGSLFDDGVSALDGHYTGCYCTSASSEYERLPGAGGDDGCGGGVSPSTPTQPGSGLATLARADSPLLGEVMTDSGLSCGADMALVGGGSLPVLLPSPPMMRPQRFNLGPGAHPGHHHRGHSSSFSSSSAFHSIGGGPMGGGTGADSLASSDYCRRDSSSGIASRASQSSSVEASMSSGSPPTSHPASSCCSNGSSPFSGPVTINNNGVGGHGSSGGGLLPVTSLASVSARANGHQTNGNGHHTNGNGHGAGSHVTNGNVVVSTGPSSVDRPSRSGRLMSHLLSSFRRKSKPHVLAAAAAAAGGGGHEAAVRPRTNSESSSIL